MKEMDYKASFDQLNDFIHWSINNPTRKQRMEKKRQRLCNIFKT